MSNFIGNETLDHIFLCRNSVFRLRNKKTVT